MMALLAAATLIASTAVSGANATAYAATEAIVAPSDEVVTEEFVVAAADCYAVGQQVAAQKGGELYGANAANRGGQEVCVVVVLVPGTNGKPPRRVEVVVPAN